MKLHEILVESSNAALLLLDPERGNMPPGHNGLYFDPETPVRNSSHWLITFLKAYEISKEKKFSQAAELIASYLCSEEIRPMNATFWHRKTPKKDACNGLMGQAWTIEALSVAAQALEMKHLLDLAQHVFLLHPFNEQLGLWQRVGVDGSHWPFDVTFNHQLWFAAAGGLIKSHDAPEIDRQVQVFLNRLPDLFSTYPSGLIYHFAIIKPMGFRPKLISLIERPKPKQKRNDLAYKAIGYHSFNLYAFALLKKQYPNHSVWQNKKIKKAIAYAKSQQYWNDIQTNKYGYPYNPPGFEIPFALDIFDAPSQSIQERWLSSQICKCYDFEENMMGQGTEDPNTHAARLYEATRLSNLQIETAPSNS